MIEEMELLPDLEYCALWPALGTQDTVGTPVGLRSRVEIDAARLSTVKMSEFTAMSDKL